MSLGKVLFSSEGRIPRSTYWLFSLGVSGIAFFFAIIDISIGPNQEGYGILTLIFGTLCIIPGIMMQIKRAHALNHSGWYILLSLIPLINIYIGIELAFFAGTDGPNNYGPDPRSS